MQKRHLTSLDKAEMADTNENLWLACFTGGLLVFMWGLHALLTYMEVIR